MAAERYPIPEQRPSVAASVFQSYIEHPRSEAEEHEIARQKFESMTPAERDLHGAILARLFPEDLDARSRASIALLVNDYVHDQVPVAEMLEAQFALTDSDAA